MTKELEDIIKKKSAPFCIDEMLDAMGDMVCDDDSCVIKLKEENILNVLKSEGEFKVIKLKYEDLQEELDSKKLKYLLSQSIHVIISFEDDGSKKNEIESLLKYFYEFTTPRQSLNFGIKHVKNFSEFPIKIIFGGILPINQLRTYLGKDIYNLITSNQEYFRPIFQKLRDEISDEIGVTILPIYPTLDKNLNPNQVQLFDTFEKKVIYEFEVSPFSDKKGIDVYLVKLFYIYKKLAQKYT